MEGLAPAPFALGSNRAPEPASARLASTGRVALRGPGGRVVFLLGLHRSGTTLLAKLLARHSWISGFAGTGVAMDEGQYLQSVMVDPRGRPLDRVGALALRRRYRLTERSPQATPENARKLWNEWRPYWNLDKPYLLEKSPANITKTRFLDYCFPNARYVLITRHPLAQAMAISKWSVNRSRFQFLLNWSLAHDYFRRDARYLPGHHVVPYERLCAHPEAALRGVFDYLEAPYEDVVDRPLDNSNAKYFAAWREKVTPDSMEMKMIRTCFSRSANRWGYDLDSVDHRSSL